MLECPTNVPRIFLACVVLMICLFVTLPFTSAQTQTLFSWSGQLQPSSIFSPTANDTIDFNAHLDQQDVVQLTVTASNTVHVEICSSSYYQIGFHHPYYCSSPIATCWDFGVSATIRSSCTFGNLKHPLRVDGDTLTFEAPITDMWYFVISNQQPSPTQVTITAMLVGGQGQQTESIFDNPLLQELRGNLPQFAIGLGIGIGIGIILLAMILKRRDSQARN